MSKLTGFFLFLIIILLLFNITGSIHDTPTSNLLTLVMNPEGITTTELWKVIQAAITVAVAAGVIFGSAVIYRTNMIFKASVTALLLTFIPDIIELYRILAVNIDKWVAVIIVGPLVFLSLMFIVEWWAGEG